MKRRLLMGNSFLPLSMCCHGACACILPFTLSLSILYFYFYESPWYPLCPPSRSQPVGKLLQPCSHLTPSLVLAEDTCSVEFPQQLTVIPVGSYASLQRLDWWSGTPPQGESLDIKESLWSTKKVLKNSGL